jgi:hypothetical protein
MAQKPARYAVARVDDLERLPAFGVEAVWRPVRNHFGIEAFGINAYTAEVADQLVVEEHNELGEGATGGQQELYLVLSGNARFTVDGDDFEARAGTFVFVRDPSVTRGAVARERGTTVLAIRGVPGQPFVVSAWEYAFRGLAKGGREGAEIFADGIARYPRRASLPYNLACMHALDGDDQAALEALRRAIELNPRVRKWAGDDEDLSSLRDSAEFKDLLRD